MYLLLFLSCVLPNMVAHSTPINDPSPSSTATRLMPDYLLRNEWWPHALSLPLVWPTSTGNGVTIASCDSGLYTEAKDLRENLLLQYARDFSSLTNSRNISDGSYVSQGTASAAIMVGVKNFQGVNGIAYNARLVPLQNFHYSKRLDKVSLEVATARCITYALTIPEVSIIAVQSFIGVQSIESSKVVRDAVEHAIKSGVTVVAPAGDGTKELRLERVYDSGSILVGAVTQQNEAAIFSNYGSRVTISAYGEKIKTLWDNYGKTQYFGGTLAASAQIAGIIALAKEKNKYLLPEDLKWLLKRTRLRTPANYNVGGLVKVNRFLTAAMRYKVDHKRVKETQQYRTNFVEKIKKAPWAQ